MATFYIVIIIIVAVSITIIINTVIRNHRAHHQPYFFYNECDMGPSVDGDEAVLGYVRTKHVCSSLVELWSMQNFTSSFFLFAQVGIDVFKQRSFKDG